MSPSLIAVLLRVLLLELLLGTFLGGLGGLVFGRTGAWITLALQAVGTVVLLFRGERLFEATFPSTESADAGLLRMLPALREAPRVRILPLPTPLFHVAVGPSGGGLILVSRGLLTLLSEEELRDALRLATARTQQSGMAWQTLLGAGARKLAQWNTPTDWNTWEVLRIWMCLPVQRILNHASHGTILVQPGKVDFDALRKVSRALRIHS